MDLYRLMYPRLWSLLTAETPQTRRRAINKRIHRDPASWLVRVLATFVCAVAYLGLHTLAMRLGWTPSSFNQDDASLAPGWQLSLEWAVQVLVLIACFGVFPGWIVDRVAARKLRHPCV